MGIQVSISLPREVLVEIRETLKAEHNRLASAMAENDRNLEALRKAIANSEPGEAVQKTLVDSESVYGKSYLVTLTGDVYGCSCPSFIFKSGLDILGHCKHIERVVRERRFR